MRASLKIGQDVEILSHMEGYRGGYFRCKIHDLKYARKNRLSLYIEYSDFPGQEFEWMQVLQSIPKHPRKGTFLMVRPLPPRIVSREEVDQISGSTIVAIVSERPWERRERVEWLENDVWWKVKVQGIREEDGFVEVQQHWPPKGERREGDRYFANPRLLRPAFSWTEAGGWTADPRRVTFLNLPEVLVSDTSMGEEPEPSCGSGVSRKRTRPDQAKLYKNTLAGGVVSRAKRPSNLWTKKFQKSSDSVAPTGNTRPSLSSEKDLPRRMGELQWQPLVVGNDSLRPRPETPEKSSTGSGAANTRTDDSALEESLQSYLESEGEGEDVRLVSERYLLGTIGTELEGLRRNLKAATQSSGASSRHNGESTGASIVSEASKTMDPHEVKNVPSTVHLTTSPLKEVLNTSGSDGLQQCKMDADTVGSVKPTLRVEVTSMTNAEASTCLLEDTKVVNNVGVLDGTRTSTSCTKEINNLGLQQCKVAPDTEEVCNVRGTEGEQQIEAATVLATSLYRDRVLPNCDKQSTRGVTVQVEQDKSAWQVICVNHDRQGDHEYYLGYCRSLEAANAARDAVKALLQSDGLSVEALLQSDGLSVDAHTDTDAKTNCNGAQITPASDHLDKNEKTPEVVSKLDQPKEVVTMKNLSPVTSTGDRLGRRSTDGSEQVAKHCEEQVDDLFSKCRLPVNHDCMDKQSKQVSNTRKALLMPKIENITFAELPRLPGSMRQGPAVQHTSWNSSRPAGALTNTVENNLATSAAAAQGVPCSPVGAVLPRQGQSVRALQPLLHSTQSMPVSPAASMPTRPVLGGMLAPHALPMQNRNQMHCWQILPQPLQDGLLGTSNCQQLHGLVSTHVAGNAPCVVGTSVHVESRQVAWPRGCIGCKRIMDGHESMGGRVDCSKCQWAYHTECALADNRLTFRRPMLDHQGPRVAGVYFTCGCNMLQLVLPRFLRSIWDGIHTLSVFLAGHQNAQTLSPHFTDVTAKLQGEICLLGKILQNAPDPFLRQMKSFIEWGSAEFMQGAHLTSEFRACLREMILQFESA